MNRVKTCVQELIKSILESEEYVSFSELRDKVRENPELRQQINDFRLQVFEVQNSQEPLDMYSEQQRLCREYEEFRKNPLVNNFLLAELSICRMLQMVASEIAAAIDLDADEVSDRIGL